MARLLFFDAEKGMARLRRSAGNNKVRLLFKKDKKEGSYIETEQPRRSAKGKTSKPRFARGTFL
ncbi:MAG TPA: hypothetical protein OIM03_03250 [Veillonellaceae bacterium]|nr:hypothetical protein [Veillonellaceae bacterium]